MIDFTTLSSVYFDSNVPDDSGDGTISNPYKVLSSDRLLAGTNAILAAGSVFVLSEETIGLLTPESSSSSPFAITVEEGVRPIIDASNTNKGIRIPKNASDILLEGFELLGPTVGADAYGISNVPPDDPVAFAETSTNIHIKNVVLHDILGDGGNSDCNGIKLYGADNIIETCRIYNIATDGIWIHGYNIKILFNDIFNIATDRRIAGDCIQIGAKSDFALIKGNYLDHSNNDGKQCIYFQNSSSVSDNVRIENNICVGFNGVANAHVPVVCGATNSVVTGNKVYGGIVGISLQGQNSIAKSNLVFASVGRGIDLSASNTQAIFNTVVQTGTQTGQTYSVGIRHSSTLNTGCTAKNNVIIGFANGITLAASGATETNNAYWQCAVNYRVSGVSSSPTNAIITDPFLNLFSYSPKENSPLIGNGNFVGIVQDKNSTTYWNPPTIGAYEYIRPRTMRS